MSKLKKFTVPGLITYKFEGFLPFHQLEKAVFPWEEGVPEAPGVYTIVRPSSHPPIFLEKGTGGSHKNASANVPLMELQMKWVPGASILYFGKAQFRKSGTGLWTRIKEYRDAGRGKTSKHQGGQYIWQLADSRELLVAWKKTTDATADAIESALIEAFREHYGSRPFANRNK